MKYWSLICFLVFASTSTYAKKFEITSGKSMNWESEVHCMTIAKIAGLPEHKMRVELPKYVSQSEFIYQLGYAEGFVRAMTIAFKESPKDSALSLYSEQCK